MSDWTCGIDGCNNMLRNDPSTMLGTGLPVCSAACALGVLDAAVIVETRHPPCPECGETYHGGRTPQRDDYTEEVCCRCAREIDLRRPRRTTA